MPRIPTIIPPQVFEIFRNRITEIFIDEIQNQYNYTGDTDLLVSITMEKKITFDKSELPRINISLADGDFSNQNMGQGDGIFRYYFDVLADSADTDAGTGDTFASVWVQKLIGKGYAIITNAQYRNLGFETKAIHRVQAGQISIGEITQGDARNIIMGRLVITIKATETTDLLEANLAEGYDTIIKIGESEVGFKYTIEQ